MVFNTSHLTAGLNNLNSSPSIHLGLLICIFITLAHLPDEEILVDYEISLGNIRWPLYLQLFFHIMSIVTYFFKELKNTNAKKRGGITEGLLVLLMLVGFVMMGSNFMNIV